MAKINVNGVTREMEPEEVAEYERLAAAFRPPEDPNEVWKTEIEAALIELAAMLGGA